MMNDHECIAAFLVGCMVGCVAALLLIELGFRICRPTEKAAGKPSRKKRRLKHSGAVSIGEDADAHGSVTTPGGQEVKVADALVENQRLAGQIVILTQEKGDFRREAHSRAEEYDQLAKDVRVRVEQLQQEKADLASRLKLSGEYFDMISTEALRLEGERDELLTFAKAVEGRGLWARLRNVLPKRKGQDDGGSDRDVRIHEGEPNVAHIITKADAQFGGEARAVDVEVDRLAGEMGIPPGDEGGTQATGHDAGGAIDDPGPDGAEGGEASREEMQGCTGRERYVLTRKNEGPGLVGGEAGVDRGVEEDYGPV